MLLNNSNNFLYNYKTVKFNSRLTNKLLSVKHFV